MVFDYWRRVLFGLCLVFAVQALSWAWIGSFDPFGFYESYMARSLWGLEALPPDAQRAFAFTLVPFGATTVGFFILTAFVVKHAFARRERWAFNAVAAAVGAWFVIDTGLCALRGAWFNIVIVNLPCAALLAVPLAAMRQQFVRSTVE